VSQNAGNATLGRRPRGAFVGVEVFTDGIRSARRTAQNAPLFRIENGDVVAATVNAAVQRANA